MKRKIVIASGGLVLAGVLAACGSSGGTSGRPLPPATASASGQSAASVLQSDGYTPDSAMTSSLTSQLGSTPGVSSLAAGESGKGIQLVVVCDSPALASAAATGEKSALGSSAITVAVNGDVVTATGPLSAWAAAGNSSPAA